MVNPINRLIYKSRVLMEYFLPKKQKNKKIKLKRYFKNKTWSSFSLTSANGFYWLRMTQCLSLFCLHIYWANHYKVKWWKMLFSRRLCCVRFPPTSMTRKPEFEILVCLAYPLNQSVVRNPETDLTVARESERLLTTKTNSWRRPEVTTAERL